jgi:predicted metallopeptidase
VKFVPAPEVLERLKFILPSVEMPYIKNEKLFCIRSWGSSSRAIARIYAFPKVFQIALELSDPVYIIEVISERFDKLTQENKDRVLIHELMHIPKTFSGSLVPHKCFGRKHICDKTVEVLYQKFIKSCL